MPRVAAFELPARFGAPAETLADVEALLERGPHADVVLLPEACITGYVAPDLVCDLRPFAEDALGPTSRRLAALARTHRTHLVGPLILREGDSVYNTMVVFSPEGERVVTYRKRHPWYVEEWAAPGSEPLASFEAHGLCFVLAICFDIHFVEEESAAELRAADVLLFPSAWVEDKDTRPELLGDLARAFDLTIVNANWGTGTPRIAGQGASSIVDPKGNVLARTPKGRGPHRIDAEVSR